MGRARSVVLAAVLLVGGLLTVPDGLLPASAAGRATFAPPYAATGLDYDSPPDGEFDYLLVEATLDVTVAGRFIYFVVFPGVNVFADWYDLDVGSRRVGVYIGGYAIRSAGADGPYDLRLEVADEFTTYLDTVNYTTGPFAATQFESSDADFAGAPTETPLDTDVPANGLYDALAVDVPVAVAEAGRYEIHLRYPGGDVYADFLLDVGLHTPRVLIPGHELWSARVSGNLWITVDFAGSRGFSTRSYTWSEFEAPPAYPGSSISDTGVDIDVPADGLYDVLAVQMPVQVNRSGDYRVTAYLETGSGSTLAQEDVSKYLTPGARTIEIPFPTFGISVEGADGPYQVICSLTSATDRDLGVLRATTQAYAWTQFDPPSVVAAGPVTDAWLDTDAPPDGTIDAYVAHVPVAVRDPGLYRIRGILWTDVTQPSAENITALATGPASVDLRWPVSALGSGVPQITRSEAYAQGPLGGPGGMAAASFPYTASAPPNTSYAPPALAVSPHFETVLPDANANGLFDALEIAVNVTTRLAGPYTFAASLLAVVSNLRVSFAVAHVDLAAGPAQVRLRFPGWTIRESLRDGPFSVVLHWRPGATDFFPSEFETDASYLFSHTARVFHHQFEADRPVILAARAGTPPTIDGQMSPGEWTGATSVTLDNGDAQRLAATAYVSSDNESLYVALDVTGDRTQDVTDAASLAFDTGALGVLDPDGDDELGIGFLSSLRDREVRLTGQVTWWQAWVVRDHPFDPAPARANLTAAEGFGASPADAMPHRTYEWRVPLTMLGVAPGATIGFAVHSQLLRGIVDGSGTTLGWPVTELGYEMIPLQAYATLTLAAPPPVNQPPVVTIAAPATGALVKGTVSVTGTASDADGSVARVDVQVDDGPWEAATGTDAWTYALNTTSVADGAHVVDARAFDGAAYSAEVRVSIVVDNTPPELAILAPAPGSVFIVRDVTIRWGAIDATSGLDHFVVILDGVTVIWSGAGLSYPAANLTDGPHTVVVRAFDAAGNLAEASVTFTVNAGGGSTSEGSPVLLAFLIVILVVVAVLLATVLVYRRRRRREEQPPPSS